LSNQIISIEQRFLSGQGIEAFTGNELLVKGALEAGASLITGYPGSPVSDVFETLSNISPYLVEQGIVAQIANNEALATARLNGARQAGLRAMAIMKSVGFHVGADALAVGNLMEFKNPQGGGMIEVGEVYYILYGDASVGGSILGNDPKDLRYWNAGNGFFTKKEADKESDKHRAIQRVKDYIIEHDMEFSPDWSNGSQYKYYPYYDESTKKVRWESWFRHRYYLPFSYLGSKEHIVQLIDDCQDDLLIIFDKK
jgi:hypothetical protein